jgi:hypothetical protein
MALQEAAFWTSRFRKTVTFSRYVEGNPLCRKKIAEMFRIRDTFSAPKTILHSGSRTESWPCAPGPLHPSSGSSPMAAKSKARPHRLSVLALLNAHCRTAIEGNPLLTKAGIQHVRHLLRALPKPLALRPDLELSQQLPVWDPERKELRLGVRLLKDFRQPAPNQTAILNAFQKKRWRVHRVADPLPPFFGNDLAAAKQRLHETIKNLNRGIPRGTIRFRGDGTGLGILWERSIRRRKNDPKKPSLATL